MKRTLITMLAVLLLGTVAFAQPLKVQEKDFDKFTKQTAEDGRILYTYCNGTVTYIYEFTEI